MKLTITRLGEDGRYQTLIPRDDGASFRLQSVAHAFSIAHDLTHFLVEKALPLDSGFWGSIDAGAVFPTMTYVGGRRKPKAAEQSKTVLKANAGQLNEAEVLVRIFNDTIEQGHSETSSVLFGRLKERWAPPGRAPRASSQAKIAEIFATYRDMLSTWRNVPVGGALALLW